MAGPLTREQILTAAEDVLRRYGPDKATVVDVARALGVSHASVYRHVSSKAELRAAVTRRWLTRVHAPVAALRDSTEDPPARLRTWLHTLLAVKRHKVLDDPELFAAYQRLTAEWQDALTATLDGLVDDIAAIVRAGVRDGSFRPVEPTGTARAIFTATLAFHHPSHAATWSDPGTEERLDAVCDLILVGLSPDRHRTAGDER